MAPAPAAWWKEMTVTEQRERVGVREFERLVREERERHLNEPHDDDEPWTLAHDDGHGVVKWITIIRNLLNEGDARRPVEQVYVRLASVCMAAYEATARREAQRRDEAVASVIPGDTVAAMVAIANHLGVAQVPKGTPLSYNDISVMTEAVAGRLGVDGYRYTLPGSGGTP